MSGVRGTPFHPKWYRRRVSVWWWLESWNYTRFVLRELTSVAVALFASVTIWQLWAIGEGPAAYSRFEARLASPPLLFLHTLALLALLFHSLTWFNLAPTAMVVRIKGRRVPDVVVAGANYMAWLALSTAVAFILLRG